ncbi:piggyBac transposable element-derived protein 5-like isoform X2 [Protopterus annectens]|nr:piggyBac transposable element-derived protein 5-like isoform X2 [Protopterus annectens]
MENHGGNAAMEEDDRGESVAEATNSDLGFLPDDSDEKRSEEDSNLFATLQKCLYYHGDEENGLKHVEITKHQLPANPVDLEDGCTFCNHGKSSFQVSVQQSFTKSCGEQLCCVVHSRHSPSLEDPLSSGDDEPLGLVMRSRQFSSDSETFQPTNSPEESHSEVAQSPMYIPPSVQEPLCPEEEYSHTEWNSQEEEFQHHDENPTNTVLPHRNATNCEGASPTPTCEWDSELHHVHVKEFVAPVGPTTYMSSERNELDFLNLMFPPLLYTKIAEETNRYSVQCQCAAGQADPRWKPVSADDIKAFLAMHIYMSLVRLAEYRKYWDTHTLYGNYPIGKIMPRVRFEKIRQYFHLNDNTTNPPKGHPGHDKLHPIRPVMKLLLKTFKTQYNLHREVSVDEAVVAFRGNLTFRQHIPAKPQKYGVRVWVLADGHNGYISNLHVHTGKEEGISEDGLAHLVLMKLTKTLHGKYHHVYFDSYFTSVSVAKALLEHGVYCCGSVGTNRSEWPGDLNNMAIKKLQQGDIIQRQSGPLLATAWKDNRTVFLLSTNTDPIELQSTICKRQQEGTHVQIPCPSHLPRYKNYMSGMDVAGQLCTKYTTGRRAVKWWIYLFWFLWDVAVTNAFILFRDSENHQVHSQYGNIRRRTQLVFREELSTLMLARQLSGSMVYRKRRAPVKGMNMPLQSGPHYPIRMLKARCQSCLLQKKRTEPSQGCMACGINLCIDCFAAYHNYEESGGSS